MLPREIANTDGDGVSLRDGCHDDDRIEGGLSEGDAVTLLEYGRGECAEWQIVGYGSDGLTTWVRERYLASAEDETPAATPVVSCQPSYPTICVPPAPPLLSCADLAFSHFQVIGTDPHGFDRDQNGVGCES